MESTIPEARYRYLKVSAKNSPNYLVNNLVRSDKYAATVKNTFTSS